MLQIETVFNMKYLYIYLPSLQTDLKTAVCYFNHQHVKKQLFGW